MARVLADSGLSLGLRMGSTRCCDWSLAGGKCRWRPSAESTQRSPRADARWGGVGAPRGRGLLQGTGLSRGLGGGRADSPRVESGHRGSRCWEGWFLPRGAFVWREEVAELLCGVNFVYLKLTNYGQDVENREPSYVGMYCGKQYGGSSKN